MYLGLALLCVALAPGCFCNEDIHKYMSDDELQQIFSAEADSVPEYEIVKLRFSERPHKRDLQSGSHFHMKAFGEDINLWLHPSDSLLAGVDTPVYYAKRSDSSPQGVEITRRDGLLGMVGRIFEDPEKMASLVIGTEVDGRTRVNGIIEAKGLVVKSLPERVVNEYRKRRSADDLEDSSYHVVFKAYDTYDEDYSLSPVNQTKVRATIAKFDTAIPETLYPEILVVVDHSVYKTFDREGRNDIYRMLEYLLAFWNGVDLKYRSLDTPKFRLNIAGFVLSEDPDATPYISQNMESADAFNNSLALPAARLFHYAEKETIPLESYDVAVIMTRLEFGLGSWTGVVGIAGIGTVCTIDHHYRTYESISFFRDDGAFFGVHVVAHELGHIFGSQHDLQRDNCPFQNGFIMAFTPWYTTNSSDFSSCSMNQFQTKLEDGGYKCLYNKPQSLGTKLPRIMPGRELNLEQQCNELGYQAPCRNSSVTDSVCVNYYCSETNGDCRETGKAALDGTACEGENKFCLHNQCVSL